MYIYYTNQQNMLIYQNCINQLNEIFNIGLQEYLFSEEDKIENLPIQLIINEVRKHNESLEYDNMY